MNISLTELEQAINYWRKQHPATGEECALSPEVNILASIYAMMIFEHRNSIDALPNEAHQLFSIWQAA